MSQNRNKETISVEQLPEKLQPFCPFSRIISVISCHDLAKSPDEEILDVICKPRFCFSKNCVFKNRNIVNLG